MFVCASSPETTLHRYEAPSFSEVVTGPLVYFALDRPGLLTTHGGTYAFTDCRCDDTLRLQLNSHSGSKGFSLVSHHLTMEGVGTAEAFYDDDNRALSTLVHLNRHTEVDMQDADLSIIRAVARRTCDLRLASVSLGKRRAAFSALDRQAVHLPSTASYRRVSLAVH